MNKIFPILDWLPNYKTSFLRGDIFAGLTIGIILIPQGIAYAIIAGLPPIYGLYTALIPQLIYTIFGTSRQLAVGPVAMVSLLTYTALSSFGNISTEITYQVQEQAFDYLDAPIIKINTADTPAPYSPVLLAEWLPNHEDVIKAVKKVLYR